MPTLLNSNTPERYSIEPGEVQHRTCRFCLKHDGCTDGSITSVAFLPDRVFIRPGSGNPADTGQDRTVADLPGTRDPARHDIRWL